VSQKIAIIILLKATIRLGREPGADRVFVFQEFDQLLPSETVKRQK
jgi:hypothetical protein